MNLYDVVAVNIETHKVRLLGQNKTLADAEAIVNMAVMRRGMDVEFYAEAPAGRFRDGDDWKKEDVLWDAILDVVKNAGME